MLKRNFEAIKHTTRSAGTSSALALGLTPTFSTLPCVGLLRDAGVPQGMDSRGRWADNAVMERRLRTLKTECVRLAEYSTPEQLRRLIGEFVEQHDERRPHKSLGCETPAEWYRPGIAEAAWRLRGIKG